jgi:acyl-CoA hydrolase
MRKTPSSSRVVMTELVLPADTNNYDTIFGGRLLALADKCAAMAAIRHCRTPVVTASFDRVDFLQPVKARQIVMLTGEVTAAFRTSLETEVTVEAEDPLSGERTKACQARITMVAVDDRGCPVAVPPLEFDDDAERERADRAEERRRVRLQTRELFDF